MRPDLVGRREEVRLRLHLQGDPARAGKVRVVVVVPGRHGVDRGVARIDERAIRSVEERPRARRDDDGLDGVRQAEVARVELRHRFAQGQDAFGRRIVRLARGEGVARRVQKALRDGEVSRVEVPDREVAHRVALGLEGADLARDSENLRAHDAAGERGEARVGLLRRLEIRSDVHCGESMRSGELLSGRTRPRGRAG